MKWLFIIYIVFQLLIRINYLFKMIINIGIVLLIMVFVLQELLNIKIPKRDNFHYEINDKYQIKEIISLILFLFSMPILSIIFTSFFNWLSIQSIEKEDSIYFIEPSLGVFLISSMIFSLGCSMSITFKTIGLFNNKNFWLYYVNKHGLITIKIFKCLGIICVVSGAILVSLNLNSYVKINQNFIEINSFTSLFKRKYKFDKVKNLIHYENILAPNGNIVKEPHYAIIFKDGFVWETDDFRSPNIKDDSLFTYLQKKTKIKIQKIETKNTQ